MALDRLARIATQLPNAVVSLRLMHFMYLLSLASLASAKATIYLIRHGEKPDDGDGLSSQGMQRAQCLRNVFGSSSGYNIGHIMAQTPHSDGSEQRPYDTVQPLGQDLGIGVDTSCDRDDSDCVADVVNSYSGSGNILICWEHKQLNNLVKAISGKDNQDNYPDDAYDIIWTMPSPYKNGVQDETSENCPGLDN